jgi:hypothetical protein
MLDAVKWAPLEIVEPDPTMPFATHSGELVIGGICIKCYRLNTGQAVIEDESLERLFPDWRELMAKCGNEIPASVAFKNECPECRRTNPDAS